jgi:hypothetical protein
LLCNKICVLIIQTPFKEDTYHEQKQPNDYKEIRQPKTL